MLQGKRLVLWVGLAVSIFSGLIFQSKTIEAKTTQYSVYPLKMADSYQRKVTINKEPLRIVSVAPNITEIIFALGKGRILVGRTNYCDYPVEVGKVELIGGLMDPNIEKIVELNPEIVIASTHFQKASLKKLEDLGISVVVLSGQESFAGVYATISKVGQIVNANLEAEAIVLKMRKKVALITTKVKGARKPKVYYVAGYGRTGDYTAGRNTFIGSLIEMAGGDNVANDTKGWQYSIEELLEKDPEIIICSKYFGTKKGIETTTGYKDLKAVKKKRLFEIDNNLLDREGPRLADGLEALAKLLHPGVFK